jgi:hypothetical protein
MVKIWNRFKNLESSPPLFENYLISKLSIGFWQVFGQKAGHVPISALKKRLQKIQNIFQEKWSKKAEG